LKNNMITIKQLEELINNKDDEKTIKYVDENGYTVKPTKHSIIEDINYTKEYKEGPFGGTYRTDYIVTIKNDNDMATHLNSPQKALEKHFKISEETGYYDYHYDDFEDILKDFKVYDATPTLHAYANHEGDDYRITIFKQDGYYYAYIVESYDVGGYKNSYVIKNTDYVELLQDLNKSIYSNSY
jgi:hypothetical protein